MWQYLQHLKNACCGGLRSVVTRIMYRALDPLQRGEPEGVSQGTENSLSWADDRCYSEEKPHVCKKDRLVLWTSDICMYLIFGNFQ